MGAPSLALCCALSLQTRCRGCPTLHLLPLPCCRQRALDKEAARQQDAARELEQRERAAEEAEAAAQQQVEAAEQQCAELEAQVAALRQQLEASMMEGEDTKQQLLLRVQTATVERDSLHAAMMQAQAHAPRTPVLVHPYAMPPAGPPPPPPQQQQQGPGGPAPPGRPAQYMPQVSFSVRGWGWLAALLLAKGWKHLGPPCMYGPVAEDWQSGRC